LQNQLPPPAGRPAPVPRDDPFLELLFGTMCQSLLALPGESFAARAGRWTDALRFTATLKPRNQQEWLHAADVTTQRYSALYSLVMQRREGATAKQRLKHGADFLRQVQAVHRAQRRYDLLRNTPAT
jgi:hypothetical protein